MRKQPRWVHPFLPVLERTGEVRAVATDARIAYTRGYEEATIWYRPAGCGQRRRCAVNLALARRKRVALPTKRPVAVAGANWISAQKP